MMTAWTVGKIPYRLALAGGWIDQPFISRYNLDPPGSMVVVSLQPLFPFMERAGMASSTRRTAFRLWGNALPMADPARLMHDLYAAENCEHSDPSGSQDMAGLVYPGISRLDYDHHVEEGIFPAHIASCCDPCIAAWLESVIHLLPINQRPAGYNPLGVQNLDPAWVRRLGQTGKDCYDSILERDLLGLGAALNDCMLCWGSLLPHTVSHPLLPADLPDLLLAYQECHPGAMYSGCGGGYLIVVSDQEVPGSFRVKIRLGTEVES
jgi:hypothetical protein